MYDCESVCNERLLNEGLRGLSSKCSSELDLTIRGGRKIADITRVFFMLTPDLRTLACASTGQEMTSNTHLSKLVPCVRAHLGAIGASGTQKHPNRTDLFMMCAVTVS